MPRPGRDGRRPASIRSTRRNAPGVIDDALQAWVAIGPNTYQLFLHDASTMAEGPDGPRPLSDETGPNVHLMVPQRKLIVDLTFMTHEELSAFRKFFNMACDLAEPVVLLRDKEAQDAFDRGDDSFHRLHRAVPQLVVRPRAKRAHGEVVRLGLAAVLDRGWDFLHSHLGTRRGGDAVADGQAPDPGTPDDAASSD